MRRRPCQPGVVRLQAENSVVAALSGTTALLLLAVFSVVNVAVLVLRREPGREGAFTAPTVIPVVGAIACLYLLGPWARLEADMIQYKIAAGMLARPKMAVSLSWSGLVSVSMRWARGRPRSPW